MNHESDARQRATFRTVRPAVTREEFDETLEDIGRFEETVMSALAGLEAALTNLQFVVAALLEAVFEPDEEEGQEGPEPNDADVDESQVEDARARREAARAAVRDNAIEVREDFESLAERANSTTEEDYGTDR